MSSKFKLEYTHCSECGEPFNSLAWPRECVHCGKVKFKNPVPVVVILQPVERDGQQGLAIGRRAIPPAIDEWALISGYAEEDAEGAAAREFREETGLEVAGPVHLAYSRVTTANQMLIVCVVEKPLNIEEYQKNVCCSENSKLDVLWSPDQVEIAFPFHREAITRWFNKEFSSWQA